MSEQVQSTVKTIKLSDIISLMAEGKTRKEINEIYGESDADMKAKVWSHPKLVNKKSAKKINFTFEDDIQEVAQETSQVYDVQEEVSEDTLVDTALAEQDLAEEITEGTGQAFVENTSTERGTW